MQSVIMVLWDRVQFDKKNEMTKHVLNSIATQCINISVVSMFPL